MRFLATGSIVCVFCVCLVVALPLPKQLTKCPPNDDQCLASAIEAAFKFLAPGAKEYGIVPLEPLFIPAMTFPAGASVVKVEQIFHNVKFYGITKGKVTSARYNNQDLTLSIEMSADSIIVDYDFDLNGQILSLPIQAKGSAKSTFVRPKVKFAIQFKEIEKKGTRYLEIADLKLQIDNEKVVIEKKKILEGNEEILDVMFQTINDNWDVAYSDVRDGYEEVLGKVYQSIANQFFSRVPEEEIF